MYLHWFRRINSSVLFIHTDYIEGHLWWTINNLFIQTPSKCGRMLGVCCVSGWFSPCHHAASGQCGTTRSKAPRRKRETLTTHPFPLSPGRVSGLEVLETTIKGLMGKRQASEGKVSVILPELVRNTDGVAKSFWESMWWNTPQNVSRQALVTNIQMENIHLKKKQGRCSARGD